MIDYFTQILDSPTVHDIGAFAISISLYVLIGVVPLFALLYAAYFIITLPMRRNERARLFLDLLELGLNDGHSPEVAIRNAASSRDRSPGVRFHLLAAYLEQGMTLGQALRAVPRLLPPRVTAMLEVGDRIGDIGKVLPACRRVLQDAISHVRGAHNYLVLLAFVVTPFSAMLPILLRIKILPSFEQVFAGMVEGGTLPPLTRWVFVESNALFIVQIAFMALLWGLVITYVGGPRLEGWLRPLFPRRLFLWPWTRKRLQRDFSAMLALLLDSGVPEKEAVKLAGDATASTHMSQCAAQVVARLEQGVRLPEALRAIGETGELQWRLSNALRRSGGFFRALAGWHESLEAKAFQQEQSAAQLTTTAVVVLNGAFVGLIVISLFWALIDLVNKAVLW